MDALEKNGVEQAIVPESSLSPPRSPSRLPIKQVLAISIFWFGLNFHWSAVGVIILQSQVYKLVGDLHKGEALAFVLVPGAFISLFANPLFGLLSDRTQGRWAVWGRRRPYILVGTLVNIGALVWMALAPDIPSLALAYCIVQFSSNAAQAPFHALLPDIVPAEQRGTVSGIMGLLSLLGNIGGVIVSGQLLHSQDPWPLYRQQLWMAYGAVIIVLFIFMLITILAVRDHPAVSVKKEIDLQPEDNVQEESAVLIETSGAVIHKTTYSWLTRSLVYTFAGTVGAIVLLWGIMALINTLHIAGIQISSDVQQVVLEIVATIGLLRVFDFNPRRDPDFAWVLFTRLVMMLGIYTIQDFLQYYMRDVLGVTDPESQVTRFILLVSLTSVASTLGAGWLSDRFGRKRVVYFSGVLMGLVGLVFIVVHSLPIAIAAGAIFGLGYGAYTSVDWALVADVLPDEKHYARDMGVWNISLSLPQVIAPVLGGPLIDYFTRGHQPVLGFQILFAMGVCYCIIGTVTVRFIRGVKR